MTTLQSAFEEALGDLPYQALASSISEKAAAQGVVLTTHELEQLAECLKSGATEHFHFRRWRWWEKRAVTVEFTEAEAEAIHTGISEYFSGERLQELMAAVVDDISVSMLRTLRRDWRSESRLQNRERAGFEKRLRQRWGRALDLLRLFRVVSLELGEMTSSALQKEPNFESPVLAEVLTRLHARACQVTDEILCLLESGFSDGAMARWRTLHEIATVAFFLKEHGEKLATRYVDHQVIESFRAACEYRQYSERMGYEPMTDSEFDEIHEAYEELVQQYGASFKTQYGWAADALGRGQPSLRKIESSVEIDHLRVHYRMASHNVHANPKGIFFKMGLMEEADILLAGPSNAGLTDPAHAAAISLMHVSIALGTIEPTFDSIVGLQILAKLVDEIGEVFLEAHDQLKEDERKFPELGEETRQP